MSLIATSDLLRQYNKVEPVQSQADQTPLGVWSYGNSYDEAYERFKDDKNFNTKLWHQSIKMGEQDQYLSFLERNKDVQMSRAYYDPTYYNYESMMLELYKPLADNENTIERKHEVYDARTQGYIEESLGEMSDQAYIQYQINQAHEIRADEITRQIEQDRKDNMKPFGKVMNTAGAMGAEFGEGVAVGVAGLLDFAVSPFYATGAAIAGENWLDAYVNYYSEVGLTAEEQKSLRASLDDWERTHTYIRDIDGNMTPVGKYMAGIANSMGMMVPAMIMNMAIPGSGMPAFYASAYGQNVHENALNPATKDSPSWIKITNALVKSGTEVVIEYGLGKLLGGTLQNQLLGLSGKGIVKEFGKHAGKQFILKSAMQEGLEEFLQDFSTNLVDQFTGMIYEGYQHTGVNFQTLVDSFFIGALSSFFMSGGAVARNAAISKITRDKETGISKHDVFTEGKDGELQKMKGFQRLAWSSMMQDFQNALKELRGNKMSVNKNLVLAREVYGGLTVMTQFYSSFSTERIANAERLLNRVSKYEQKYLSDVDVESIKKADLNTFADIIHNEFTSMVGEVGARYSERVKKAVNVVSEKLKDSDVTQIKSANNKGTRHSKDPAIMELEAKLKNKYDELEKKYEWVFTTDGHIAVETDGMLFVSEAWLENYETSEIYKFLAQEQILQAILTDKELAPLIKEVVKHNKEFIGQKTDTAISKGGTLLEIKGDINEAKLAIDAHIRNARDVGPFTDTHFMISYRGQIIDITEYGFDDTNKNRSVEDLISRLPKANTTERALMDLLFNKSVYQHFLLSNKGKNIFKFKDFIFRIHELIKAFGEIAPETNLQKRI